MLRFYFKKLVRDKVVQNCLNDPMVPVTNYRKLDSKEHARELIRKINEEADEVEAAWGEADLVEEIADLQDIVDNLQNLAGFSDEQIQQASKKKHAKNGGFKEGHYIEYVDLDESSEWVDILRRQPDKYPEGIRTKTPIFITGNQSKADYLSHQLGVKLDHQKVELDELQSTDLHVIVEHKLRQAHEVVKAPVLVEDVSLVFNALGELPGPYIKWFVDYAGAEACCRMLDGFENRSAVIRCTFGYFDGKRLEFFDSEMPGSISDSPRGENGFGFDTFFIGEGLEITRAEMSQDEVERTYAEQMKPFTKVRSFLQALEDAV